MAVSYTHLDVYKRQALDDAAVRASAQTQLMPALLNGSGIPSQAMLMFDYAVEAP